MKLDARAALGEYGEAVVGVAPLACRDDEVKLLLLSAFIQGWLTT